jgi:hypothetical protein
LNFVVYETTRVMNIFCSAALWSSWSFLNKLWFQEKRWSGVNCQGGVVRASGAALCTDGRSSAKPLNQPSWTEI